MREGAQRVFVALTALSCRSPLPFGVALATMTTIGVQMLSSTPGSAQSGERAKRITFATATLGGENIDVGLYRPTGCEGGALLIVFHGYERDAEHYLKSARRIAREKCMTVVAPRFDKERFPRWRYQRAGVKRGEGDIDLSMCIGPLVAELVDWAKRQLNSPHADYVLFGHSAGAQMLSRLSAYCPLQGPSRIVIANPSSHVAPTQAQRVPYGFKAAGSPAQQNEFLRRYLAQPITIYLGGDDIGEFRMLNNRAAQRQGRNRLERGRTIYDQARRLAEQNGWTLNWRLVEAPGVGHSGRGMLRAPIASAALASSAAQPLPELSDVLPIDQP